MTHRMLNRTSLVRVIAAVALSAETLAIMGLYAASMLLAGGIGPEDPGTETVSTFGVRVFTTAIFLPLAVVSALTAVAVVREPARSWKRVATLVALVLITLGDMVLAVFAITAGHLGWALSLGAATVVLSTALWQLFNSHRNHSNSRSEGEVAARS